MTGTTASVRRVVIGWLCALTVVMCCKAAHSAELGDEQRRAVLAEAMTAYDSGIAVLRSNPDQAKRAFREAAERMQLLVDDGVTNGRLLYNLGNAYLQGDQLGRAIASYRRAEQLIPGDARLRANLAYARSRCRLQLEPTGGRALGDALLWWHHNTSLGARTTVFVVAYTLFWIALAGRVVRGAGAPALTITAIVTGILWIAVGVSLLLQTTTAQASIGVIVHDDVTVRKGDGTGFEPQLEEPLHEGVEFELIEQRGDWLLIELADGTSGWVRLSEAVVI